MKVAATRFDVRRYGGRVESHAHAHAHAHVKVRTANRRTTAQHSERQALVAPGPQRHAGHCSCGGAPHARTLTWMVRAANWRFRCTRLW